MEIVKLSEVKILQNCINLPSGCSISAKRHINYRFRLDQCSFKDMRTFPPNILFTQTLLIFAVTRVKRASTQNDNYANWWLEVMENEHTHAQMRQ